MGIERLLLAGALFVAAVGCGDSSNNSGGAGSGAAAGVGPSGPGSGPNATSTGTKSGPNGATSSIANGSSSSGLVLYGQPFEGGQYNLGPVDYSESQFHNACAPGTKYASQVQGAEGVMLAGLWNGIPNVGGLCDACIWVTTPTGHSAMLRVVTYGDTSTNSIDTSPEAYQMLDTGEYPRPMTWQLAECPDSGPMMYEFQTGANEYWTSLWVRNARVPLAKVEVESVNHASYIELARGGDGTLTDASGFGAGAFTIRSTGVDGQTVEETFQWPGGGIAGAFLTGQANFQ